MERQAAVRHWKRAIEIAVELGADVPACIYSRPLRMRGIGEQIDLVERFPAFPAVLINPGVPVPTGEVFKAFDETDPPELRESKGRSPQILDWLNREPNDLERPAMRLEPKIKKALNWLDQQKGVELARMSGSGASCFAIFDTDENAEQAADAYEGFAVEVGLGGIEAGEVIWS